MKVRCVHNTVDGRQLSVTPGETYEVLAIADDSYRLIDDRGEPYLFEAEAFEIIDDTRPSEWVMERGDEGEEYTGPVEFQAPGFWEDFFEHKPEARMVFARYLNRHLRTSGAA